MLSKRARTRALRTLAILGLLLALAVAAVVIAVDRLVLGKLTDNAMPENGVISLFEQPDGTLYMEWTAGIRADGYTVEIRSLDTGELLLSKTTTECSCTLSGLPREEQLTISVQSGAWHNGKHYPGSRDLAVTLQRKPPVISDLQWSVDSHTGVLYLSANLDSGTACRVQVTDPQGVTGGLQELVDGKATLHFGGEGGYPVPGVGGSYTLTLTAYRKTGQLVYYSAEHKTVTVSAELFPDKALKLQSEAVDGNALKLTWNETGGDVYELEHFDGGAWKNLCSVRKGQILSFTTGSLKPCRDYRFRVTAKAGQSEILATAELTVTTGVFSQYATIWPLIDLPIYTDAGKSAALGTAPAGSAYCVLREENGLFRIRHGETFGYVDSNYCMVNLPDYMGELCAYNITNSYASKFRIHEYDIPKVTGTVVQGYAYMKQRDGSYLVPLLYPTAKKLAEAAQTARAQGYRLKIYEAYRPREATLAIYDLTQEIIRNPVPQHPDGLSFEQLMTDNGRYALSNFLAKGISNHNRGIALDLTLETLAGTELAMQTQIHDLSWYSEPSANNEPANLLYQIMTGAGLMPLRSEWWHFQDEEAKQNLTQIKQLHSGVDARCWVKDNLGWRYRMADGSWLTECVRRIDGISYSFDARGYAQVQ